MLLNVRKNLLDVSGDRHHFAFEKDGTKSLFLFLIRRVLRLQSDYLRYSSRLDSRVQVTENGADYGQ